ncbi:aminodeoxychorismate synthase component I [Croceicoccus sp. F390]|uniref:Probable branched-chain-amino-acid aminotransferase n=1 Tax=Croceicoccus esteveae TaxID=3075597 RepID=A0ABU2ZMR5_9SPHN|nr:aminodeoxychorismate synthase component I [Croceicoccus sp. F390]MDT0576722.1 aminodeoxychorismate synthase component I [Croceicoccus sp. F390]
MTEPFILIDDARPRTAQSSRHEPVGSKPAGAAMARLYRQPRCTIMAATNAEVPAALAQIAAALEDGCHVAGMFGYELGAALEASLPAAIGQAGPLIRVGVFDSFEAIAGDDVPGWLDRQANMADGPPMLSPLLPNLTQARYAHRFAELQERIVAGDIYQVNYTFALQGRWLGDALCLYALLRPRAAAGHGAILFDGEDWVLSFSPELFFALSEGQVTLRPMKGTRPRGTDPLLDAQLAAQLASSGKDRAENLMITDLMRNDISRVAKAGSVRVEKAFAVETYPTVHQLVTTIEAQLDKGTGALEILGALFPCGSVTGAPKIRAMQLIAAAEPQPRGVYCGAIGYLEPGGNAAFNVAIRTLLLQSNGCATLGVGSAIVNDSQAGDEWDECLVKGLFAAQATPAFSLIETMFVDPAHGIALLDLHLARLSRSADQLGFACDMPALRRALLDFSDHCEERTRLRLLLDTTGRWQIEPASMPAVLQEPVPVCLQPLGVSPGDWRLAHKTTLRDFYDDARQAAQAAGATEAALVREDGLLTEGSFTNIFVERGGRLLTPPATLGLLPGVMRQQLLDEGIAQEAELTAADLAQGFFLANALRGVMKARLI